MKRLTLIAAISLAGAVAASADPREDSLALLNAAVEASNALAPLVEGWAARPAPSASLASLLRDDVLAPLETAQAKWFDAGLAFGGSDDNPYRAFMICHDGAEELRQQVIQFAHFNAGSWDAEKVTLDHIEPGLTKLDGCATALKE